MRVSLTWLQDFIEFKDSDPQRIAADITAHTAEVDEVEMQGKYFDNCCVGKILSVESHPNADRLSLCEVETDKGKKTVVCGGSNLLEGMTVAFAHVGATVSGGGEPFTLKVAKIRGVESSGMICAAEELELEKVYPSSQSDGNRPVINLGADDKAVGKSLREYLGMDDVILHIDNHSITHRPDLFSQVGFARECVAMGIATWKKKPEYQAPSFAKDDLPLKIINKSLELVPRYACCVLEIDELGETPDYMKTRLAAADWRSINVPVDITNFVSSEVGMPLHSFDLNDIEGDVTIRTTKKGETITTLDEQERELPEGALVLSDKQGIFDLLGIMGGLRSSTKPGTRRILLHSAAVAPSAVRLAVKATGHRTEAATIYEKGIAPVVVEQGFYRALELFLKHVPGAHIVSVMENRGDNGEAPTIELSADRTRKLIGADVPTKEMARILQDLECEVQVAGEQLTVTPPLHRIGDLEQSHDLVEEIARMYGYNNITPVMPTATLSIPPRDTRTKELRRALQLRGGNETLPLSLLGPDLLKKCRLNPDEAALISNPIGEELSLMQLSVLPRLLEQAGENVTRTGQAVRLFNIASVFNRESDAGTELGIVYAARHKTNIQDDPFLQLKQDLSGALQDVGYTLEIKADDKPSAYAHPGRAGNLLVQGQAVGEICEVLPAVRSEFDLPDRAAAVKLNLSALLELEAAVTVAQPLPQFPAVTYDETLPMDHAKSAGALIAKAEKASDLLESVVVADIFAKEDVYNLTLRFTYRAGDRTLTEEEAKAEHGKVKQCISKAV